MGLNDNLAALSDGKRNRSIDQTLADPQNHVFIGHSIAIRITVHRTIQPTIKTEIQIEI